MRIRRNANVSAFILSEIAPFSSPTIKLEPHVCTLNQSPWDVINFSPPSTLQLSTPQPPSPIPSNQVNNGSGFSDVKERSVVYTSPAKWEEQEEVKCEIKSASKKLNSSESALTAKVRTDTPVKSCRKTDGKGWQCKNITTDGSTMCEHHLALARNHNRYSSSQSAKMKRAVVVSMTKKRRPRAKKAGSSNPHDFYYYSGFGPRWGKKRGMDNKEDDEIGSAAHHVPKVKPTSSSSQTSKESEHIDDDKDDEEKKLCNKRKRARKSVKARSLKSLTM